MLPRGTVVNTELRDDELLALEARSAARGARAAGLAARKVRRSLQEEMSLHAFCGWLNELGVDTIGTVSFTDEYAERRGIYTFRRALDDVWEGLHDVPLKRGSRHGFRNRFILSAEWHPSGRTVPHVHVALESGTMPSERLCDDLWGYFFGTRGRSRFEPMRDVAEATLYALKDTIKASARDADCVRFRLHRPKRGGKR